MTRLLFHHLSAVLFFPLAFAGTASVIAFDLAASAWDWASVRVWGMGR